MNAESPHAEVVLPQPVIEKYARLGMTSPAVDVAATTYHYGFDRFTYPGDTVMQYWWSNTPMFWTGFYLAPAPQHSDTSWMTKYNTARHMGWGFAPLYVGRQVGDSNLTEAQGRSDAHNAAPLRVRPAFRTCPDCSSMSKRGDSSHRT
jgi:hypothetical protein